MGLVTAFSIGGKTSQLQTR